MEKHLFVPGIWDRLMAAAGPTAPGATPPPALQSLPELKASIARDLEDLFNTRVALPDGTLDSYKACQQSILNFGLMDFAALCLGNSEDRTIICEYLKETIDRFEPRLTNVSAAVTLTNNSTNRLDFVIHATIKGHASAEPVKFNAMLQPSTLHYSISQVGSRSHNREPQP